MLDNNGELPYDLTDAVIYYAGPTPAPEGKAIGSCAGPYYFRQNGMDRFETFDLGLGGMIGKGERSKGSERCHYEK